MRVRLTHASPAVQTLPLEDAPDDPQAWMRGHAGPFASLELTETAAGWPVALVRGEDGRRWAFYRFYHLVGAAVAGPTAEDGALRASLLSGGPDLGDQIVTLSDLWRQ